VHVEADDQRMTQALANLLVNAAKYTPAGGRLELRVTKLDGHAEICVCDNGIGIEAGMLDRVFDLFTQAESGRRLAQGGLGIGLSLVKQIVAMHDGTVEAHSGGLGRGSRFTVRLPLTTSTPQDARALAALDGSSITARRVLVADDNIDAAQSLGTLLQLQGHEVEVVFDGEQAVEAAQRFHPEVVLLDLGMPKLDGIGAARRLRACETAARATLVALTGWGQDADRSATRAAGFDHHLVKPVTVDVLEPILAGASGHVTP
jgi:CheY-like chemotaxis protein